MSGTESHDVRLLVSVDGLNTLERELTFVSSSVMGNLTYMGAVLFPSTNANHVYINFSWLVGSGGTVSMCSRFSKICKGRTHWVGADSTYWQIFLDFVVLGQHAYYWKERSKKAYIAGGESDIVGI